MWVFERAPAEGCEGHEGFQYVGVGSSEAVAGYSGEIREGLDSTPLWPYGTLDINRDGIDEMAVGVDGSEVRRRASIILFRVGVIPGSGDRVGVERMTMSCGSVCTQAPHGSSLGSTRMRIEARNARTTDPLRQGRSPVVG